MNTTYKDENGEDEDLLDGINTELALQSYTGPSLTGVTMIRASLANVSCCLPHVVTVINPKDEVQGGCANSLNEDSALKL